MLEQEFQLDQDSNGVEEDGQGEEDYEGDEFALDTNRRSTDGAQAAEPAGIEKNPYEEGPATAYMGSSKQPYGEKLGKLDYSVKQEVTSGSSSRGKHSSARPLLSTSP